MDKEKLILFIKEIITLFKKSSASEIEVEEEGIYLRLRRISSSLPSASRDFPSLSSEEKPVTVKEEAPSFGDNVYILRAPMTGVFYRAPSPNAPPFVEEGDIVRKGQRIALLEAMKIFNDINADVTGRILKIFAQNASIVQEGAPLFAIEPMEEIL